MSSNSSPDVTENLVSENRNIQVDQELELRKDIRKTRKESFQDSPRDESIVFENSFASTTDVRQLNKSYEPSSANKSSLFRKPSEVSDDDEDTEEVEAEPFNEDLRLIKDERDMVIFIQMAPYPLTLEDFIWSEQQTTSKTTMQHCFHTSTTARILLAILDGVEYIHSQDIVHRDLKPSNIFLSLNQGKYQPEGSINVTDCSECRERSKIEDHVFVTPHIGDFGLIAKVNGTQPWTSPCDTTFSPSPLAVLSSVASSRQPGTKFYCAPKSSKARRISPALDVYSIGVIAYEMLTKFRTRSERLVVLNNLNHRNLDTLVGHRMEAGIRGMLEHDEDKRWSCATVRQWLCDVLKTG